jgi:hypothetical protein
MTKIASGTVTRITTCMEIRANYSNQTSHSTFDKQVEPENQTMKSSYTLCLN